MQQVKEAASQLILIPPSWDVQKQILLSLFHVFLIVSVLSSFGDAFTGPCRQTCSPVGSELMEACPRTLPAAEADNKIKIQLWCHGDLEQFKSLTLVHQQAVKRQLRFNEMFYYTYFKTHNWSHLKLFVFLSWWTCNTISNYLTSKWCKTSLSTPGSSVCAAGHSQYLFVLLVPSVCFSISQ